MAMRYSSSTSRMRRPASGPGAIGMSVPTSAAAVPILTGEADRRDDAG
jgi:hypothetical protein